LANFVGSIVALSGASPSSQAHLGRPVADELGRSSPKAEVVSSNLAGFASPPIGSCGTMHYPKVADATIDADFVRSETD
jgi:hypothetical protein